MEGRKKPGGRGGKRLPNGLTVKQDRFATHVANGVSLTDAAKLAGYAHYRGAPLRSALAPEVRQRIFEARQRKLEQYASLAPKVIGELMLNVDGKTPHSVRIQAATWLVNLAGHVAPKPREASPDGTKDLRDLSLAELEALYAKRLLNQRTIASGTIEGEATTVPVGTDGAGQAIDIIGEALPTEGSDGPAGEGQAPGAEPEPDTE